MLTFDLSHIIPDSIVYTPSDNSSSSKDKIIIFTNYIDDDCLI